MDNTGSKIAQAAIGRIRVSACMYTNLMIQRFVITGSLS